MSINTPATLAQINGLASELGLDNWQIQQASWNGYIFSTTSNNVLDNLGTGLGQISSVIGAAQNITTATQKIIGNSSSAGSVPGGAKMVAMDSIDRFTRKIAINKLPNGKDNIRGLGYNGQEIIMTGILWGTNYLTGLKNNLIGMYFSDDLVIQNNPTSYHVLNHPFFGQINGCWLVDMEIVHKSSQWRAAVYKLKFQTEEPIIITQSPDSLLNTLNNIISSSITIASSLNALWSTFNFIQTNSSYLKTFKNNIIIQNQVQRVQSRTLASTNNAISITKLLTTGLAPENYKNIPLNNFPTTDPTLTQLKYFQGNFTPNDVNNINQYLTDDINATISLIYAINTNDFNDTIDYLKLLITQVSSLSITLLNSYYGNVQTYIIPYNMSLAQVCFLNNIDYQSNVGNIIALNQNRFFWLNNLNKGESITLPNGN